MKKLFGKLLQKLIKKSVSEVVADQMPDTANENITSSNPKKELWKFIIQTIINILAAVLTALGATSCVSHLML